MMVEPSYISNLRGLILYDATGEIAQKETLYIANGLRMLKGVVGRAGFRRGCWSLSWRVEGRTCLTYRTMTTTFEEED